MPALNPRHVTEEARIQKARNGKRLPTPAAVTPEEVYLQPGHFRNADGTETPILQSLTPGASGIILATATQAEDILQTLVGSVVDELAILIVGHDCPAPQSCGGKLTFPACARRNHAPLLIAGCIHNVGPTAIVSKLEKEASVSLPDVRLFQFDMVARDFETEDWTRATQAPVRIAQERFTDAGLPKTIMEPWARRFTLNGRPSQPDMADKISFMAKVCESKVDSLLKASGHNNVYLTPRTDQLQLSSSYAIIWLGESRHEALKACMTVPEQLGLVQARSRYGVRVAAGNFDRLHTQLKPGQPVPTRIQVSAVFRLGPTPASAGPAQIQEWAIKMGWAVRVLKPSGHRHWQVGSADPPPLNVMGWDGTAVLVTPIVQGVRQPSVVKSGRMPKAEQKPQVHPTKDADATDPWMHNDPWRQARLGSKPPVASSTEPRALQGPVESRLQAQDQRLSALETDLKLLRKEQTQQRLEDRASFTRDLEGVQQQVQSPEKLRNSSGFPYSRYRTPNSGSRRKCRRVWRSSNNSSLHQHPYQRRPAKTRSPACDLGSACLCPLQICANFVSMRGTCPGPCTFSCIIFPGKSMYSLVLRSLIVSGNAILSSTSLAFGRPIGQLETRFPPSLSRAAICLL